MTRVGVASLPYFLWSSSLAEGSDETSWFVKEIPLSERNPFSA
jgi:hypothetical protein